MKIELTESKSYSFPIGDNLLTGFRVISKWNGMTELRDEKGEKIIVANQEESSFFADVFLDALTGNGGPKDKKLGATILSASPRILAMIAQATKA